MDEKDSRKKKKEPRIVLRTPFMFPPDPRTHIVNLNYNVGGNGVMVSPTTSNIIEEEEE
jgi:hypothetical protein